jgi:methionine-S-sulfoxide reductase
MTLRLLTFLIAIAAVLGSPSHASDKTAATTKTAVATFAAGCFWCTEADFDKVPGVLTTISGYMGGHVKNPTYQQVSRGGTGHTEVLQVTYDPSKVDYDELLKVFWKNVDPFDKDGQFCDRGDQYRPEIFVHSEAQRAAALASKAEAQKLTKIKQDIIVPITDASTFTKAEEYHQDFYKKDPAHYWRYRIGCGRDRRLEQIWGKKPKS